MGSIDVQTRRKSQGLAALTPFAFALIVTAAIIDWRIAAALVAVPLLLSSIYSPLSRLAWFTFGGLILFDTGSSVGPKLLYALMCALLVFISGNLLFRERQQLSAFNRTLVATAAGYLLLISTTILYAVIVLGIQVSPAVRDGVTHALPGFAILLGLETGRSLSIKKKTALIASASTLAVIQFALTWMSRRGAIQGEIFLLGSRAMLSFALMFFLLQAASRQKWLFLGTVGATASITSAVLSGNRSSLLILTGLLALPFSKKGPATLLRVTLTATLVLTLGLAIFYQVIPQTPYAEFIHERQTALASLFSDGLSNDASGASRLEITKQALHLFSQYPITGAGVGSISSVDSPAVYLAKFGLLGTALLAAFFYKIFRTLYKQASIDSVGKPLAASWSVALAASLVSATPTSDPGLAIGLALLACLCTPTRAER